MGVESVVGTIIEALPNSIYKVDVGGTHYLCYVAGKMRKNKINVLVGDKVEVVLDPYGGKTTNRIVRRK